MTLVAHLEFWRKTLTEGHAQDGEPTPTEEEVLGQFLYSALDDCFYQTPIVDAWLEDGVDFQAVLNAWVDAYAAERG